MATPLGALGAGGHRRHRGRQRTRDTPALRAWRALVLPRHARAHLVPRDRYLTLTITLTLTLTLTLSLRCREIEVVWDVDGRRYGGARGLSVWVDGELRAQSATLTPLVLPWRSRVRPSLRDEGTGDCL